MYWCFKINQYSMADIIHSNVEIIKADKNHNTDDDGMKNEKMKK